MNAVSELTLRLAVWLQLAGQDLRAAYRRGSALERGQGMVEYSLILALVAIAAVVILVALGDQIGDTFQGVVNTLKTPPTPTG